MASSPYEAASLFNVDGLVAVITGGGSGLGAVTAHALVANGAKAVFILGRREASLTATKQGSTNPDAIHPVVCDVTSKESLAAAASSVRAQIGYIDVLFVNSGITRLNIGCDVKDEDDIKNIQQVLWEPDMSEFTETMHVNVTGAFYTVVAFLDILDEGNKRAARTQKSQIVLTSSVAGFVRRPSSFCYSASKVAVTQLTKQLSTKLAPHMIRVNAVAPGFFPSEMTQTQMAKGKGDPRHEGSLSSNFAPLQRMGTEEEFAGVVLFLASRAGAYLDGCVLVVDGGRLGILPNSY